ncbi:MAG: nitroreductase family protein [Victivallaceae bacterium]|nr:nitroreductase family protein [Victivallaceae bacterium]
MDFTELLKRRTIRFFEQRPVSRELLDRMLEAAALAPSAANRQPLRYMVVETAETVLRLLRVSKYGGYVAPERIPEAGKTGPMAFIALYAKAEELQSTLYADAGAAVMSMEFSAWENGLGCCWVGAFDKTAAKRILNLPEGDEVLFLLALGYPAEHPQVERIDEQESIRYYLDDAKELHVPKHKVSAIAKYC